MECRANIHLPFPSVRSCVAIAHIAFGVITVCGAIYRLVSPPAAGLFGPRGDAVVDTVFGILVVVTSALWLTKGVGWGRYVACAWLLFLAVGVYIPAWFLCH